MGDGTRAGRALRRWLLTVRVGDEGILLTSGLRSAGSKDTVGMTGKLFQVGGRAAVNSASCNGGHTEDYC
jgi:hypothetical protein